MNLVTANNIRRGHKAGHYLLVLYDRILLFYRSVIDNDKEIIKRLVRMSLHDFYTVASALWEYGKSREKVLNHQKQG